MFRNATRNRSAILQTSIEAMSSSLLTDRVTGGTSRPEDLALLLWVASSVLMNDAGGGVELQVDLDYVGVEPTGIVQRALPPSQ
jgi:hypothetical protein